MTYAGRGDQVETGQLGVDPDSSSRLPPLWGRLESAPSGSAVVERGTLWLGGQWRFHTVRCVIMILFLPPGWCGLQSRDYTARELAGRRLYSEKRLGRNEQSLFFSFFF